MPDPQVLSPAEVLQARKSLEYSVAEFAVLLDVSAETVRSWESGRRRCRGPAAVLIGVIDRMEDVHQLVRRLSGVA